MTLNDIVTQLGRMFGRNPATDAEFTAEVTDNVNQIMKELGRTAWGFWLSEDSVDVIADQTTMYLPRHIGRIEDITDSEDEHYSARGYDRLLSYNNTIKSAGNKTYALGPTAARVSYNTGTVDATNGSVTITGTGTTYTSAMIGYVFQVAGDNRQYVIVDVPDATTLTLMYAYDGTTSTGSSYELNPIGTKTLSFLPMIDADGTLTLTYYRIPQTMQAVTEIPDLPEEYHAYLVWKSRERMLNVDEERQHIYQHAFQQASGLLKMMKTDDAKRIQSKNPTITVSP